MPPVTPRAIFICLAGSDPVLVNFSAREKPYGKKITTTRAKPRRLFPPFPRATPPPLSLPTTSAGGEFGWRRLLDSVFRGGSQELLPFFPQKLNFAGVGPANIVAED